MFGPFFLLFHTALQSPALLPSEIHFHPDCISYFPALSFLPDHGIPASAAPSGRPSETLSVPPAVRSSFLLIQRAYSCKSRHLLPAEDFPYFVLPDKPEDPDGS